MTLKYFSMGLLASAAYRDGIPQSETFRDDLAQVVEQSQPSVEKNLG